MLWWLFCDVDTDSDVFKINWWDWKWRNQNENQSTYIARSHTYPIFSNKLVSLRRCRIYGFTNNNVYQRISIFRSGLRNLAHFHFHPILPLCTYHFVFYYFRHSSPYFKFEFYFQIDCYYAMPCRNVCAVHANATNVSLNIGWAFYFCSAARLWCAAHAQSR